MKKNKKKA